MPHTTKIASIAELTEHLRLLQTEYTYEKESYLENQRQEVSNGKYNRDSAGIRYEPNGIITTP